ncbi:MAG: DUF3846 domain-containing protein [Ruminococcaceae bacterium]|nr:DUF3846 domain-containing protein [Oscillospiraceae bacterium]
MNQTEIKVLKVEPMNEPKVVTLKTDLDSLQKAVSIGADYQGLIEIITIDDGVCILCNEEGKLIGLDGNRRIGNDIIAGVFYVVGENDEGELISLTDQQLEFYEKRFFFPEYYTKEDIANHVFITFC